MPIGFNGQQYQSELELYIGGSQEPQESSESVSGTPVPNSENNAPAASGQPPRAIPEDITRITVRPQSDYVNPPENTPSFRPTISGMVKGIYDSIKTWGDAIQGKVPTWAMDDNGEFHTSPQVLEKSLDLAGLAVMGPAPVASKLAEGTLGSFAGVRSATLDKAKLYKAQSMEMSGAHPDEIWQQTGFFKGADNRWRYEIPNDMSNLKASGTEIVKGTPAQEGMPSGWGAEAGSDKIRIKTPNVSKEVLTPEVINSMTPDELGNILTGGQSLKNVLHNPELFKAYPFLEDVLVKHIPEENGLRGQFNPGDNSIYMAPAKADEFLSTLQHEVQHAIQTHEGFARGGNSQMFASPEYLNKKAIFERSMDRAFSVLKQDHPDFDFNNLRAAIEAKNNGNYDLLKEIRPTVDATIKEAKKRGFYDVVDKYITAARKIDEVENINYQKYRRLMGEVEARNVQARLDFDNTDRFLKSPRSTEDIPRFLQRDPGDANTYRFSEAESLEYSDGNYQFPDTGPSQYDNFRRSDNVDDRRQYDILKSLKVPDSDRPELTRDQVKAWLDKNPEEFSELAKTLGIAKIPVIRK